MSGKKPPRFVNCVLINGWGKLHTNNTIAVTLQWSTSKHFILLRTIYTNKFTTLLNRKCPSRSSILLFVRICVTSCCNIQYRYVLGSVRLYIVFVSNYSAFFYSIQFLFHILHCSLLLFSFHSLTGAIDGYMPFKSYLDSAHMPFDGYNMKEMMKYKGKNKE